MVPEREGRDHLRGAPLSVGTHLNSVVDAVLLPSSERCPLAETRGQSCWFEHEEQRGAMSPNPSESLPVPHMGLEHDP